MTNFEIIKALIRDKGKADALDLRARAPEITGTQIIDEEHKIPAFDPGKDYTEWTAGAPVYDDGEVYALIQPYNAAHYPDTRPKDVPALWRVVHTTNPKKAKPWVQPTSTSDMYLVGECMIWSDGLVYRSLRDTNFSPAEYAPDWEAVSE